jgi:hypothetical protein
MNVAVPAPHVGWIFAATLTLWIVLSAVLPALPQPQSYHSFADARPFAGIPNFWNVVSNAAFLLVGVLGLREVLVHAGRFLERSEIWPYASFFGATVLVALGSTYYHLAPDDARLVWDRLPIGLATAALPIAVLSDRAGAKVALPLLLPALIAGALSVLYWRMSALRGHENLVPYLLLQLFSLGAVIGLALQPGRYTRVGDWWTVIGIYVVARLAEVFDRVIYAAGGILSGHTFKHLVAALAAVWVLRMIRLRQPVAAAIGSS